MFGELARVADVGLDTKADISKDNVDIGKRIDVNKTFNDKSPNGGVDVSKRIDVSEKKELSISDSIKEYLADLKEKSKFADTIHNDCIDPSKLEIKSPEDVKKLREEFDDNKSKLIAEWEKNNHCEWPRYTEEDIKEKNITDRKPGDRYDAHHIHSLQTGGENVATNITPLDAKSHREIHSGRGKALVDAVKGGSGV